VIEPPTEGTPDHPPYPRALPPTPGDRADSSSHPRSAEPLGDGATPTARPPPPRSSSPRMPTAPTTRAPILVLCNYLPHYMGRPDPDPTHPRHRPLGGPRPPLSLQTPVFFGFLRFGGGLPCCHVLSVHPARVLRLGPPASLRSLGYRPRCARLLPGMFVWPGDADVTLFPPGRGSLPPRQRPYVVLTAGPFDVHSFLFSLQHHPMTSTGNRFLLIVHPDAWVVKPFQVTVPSLLAEQAYCGP